MYLCRFAEVDGIKSIAMALERTCATVASKLDEPNRKGLVEKYKRAYNEWRSRGWKELSANDYLPS